MWKNFFNKSNEPEDLLGRQQYADVKDSLHTFGYFAIYGSSIFAFALVLLYIRKVVTMSVLLFTIPMVILSMLYRYLPRKCPTCGGKLKTVYLWPEKKSIFNNSRKLYLCCDTCKTKAKTLMSESDGS